MTKHERVQIRTCLLHFGCGFFSRLILTFVSLIKGITQVFPVSLSHDGPFLLLQPCLIQRLSHKFQAKHSREIKPVQGAPGTFRHQRYL